MKIDWGFVFSGIVMAIFGFYALRIGIMGLAKKRPLAYSTRILMWLFFVYFLGYSVKVIIDLFSRWDPMMLFLLLSIVFLLFLTWRDTKGYVVAGIYDRTFREALASALNKLNVHPEETILKRRLQETTTRLRLVEFNADLQAVIAEWNGSARIYIKQREHANLIKSIADEMNDYFSSTSIKVNNFAFIVQLILGIFMLVMAVLFAFGSRW